MATLNKPRPYGRGIISFIAAILCMVGVAKGTGVEVNSVSQIAGSTDILAGLVTQGLRGASSNPPLNMGNGTLTCGAINASGTLSSSILASNTWTTSANSATQFFGAWPVSSDLGCFGTYLQGQAAYYQAATNVVGGSVYIYGGPSVCFFNILTASNLSGKTFTLTRLDDNSSITLTDGTTFTHSATNSVEATNLGAALTGTFGVANTVVGSVVYVGTTSGPASPGRFASTNAVGTDCAVPSVVQCGDVHVGNQGAAASNVYIGGPGVNSRISFFGATATTQSSGGTDIVAGLVAQGLRATTTNPPMNLGSGAITAGSVSGANGTGSDGNASGVTQSTGLSTGLGKANWKLTTGWTLGTGSTLQTVGDRLVVSGHNVTMSTTTATATTILVLNVPTSGSAGSVIIKYMLQNTGSAIVPGCTSGQFTVSCSNNSGTVTATAGALTGVASNVGAFTAFSAGTISTSIASQAVSIRIAPTWSGGTSTGVVCSLNAECFGNGVTITTQ